VTTAQVSVFGTGKNLTRVKTLSIEAKGEYVCSAFCGENSKYLACLMDAGEEKEIHMWQWEKEKMFKTASCGGKVTKLSASPNHTMVLTSGVSTLKSWYVAADATLKAENLLPPVKELEHMFLDHLYIPAVTTGANPTSEHRLLVIGDHDVSLNPNTPGVTPGMGASRGAGAGDDGGSVGGGSVLSGSQGGGADRNRQTLFVFDGVDQPKV